MMRNPFMFPQAGRSPQNHAGGNAMRQTGQGGVQRNQRVATAGGDPPTGAPSGAQIRAQAKSTPTPPARQETSHPRMDSYKSVQYIEPRHTAMTQAVQPVVELTELDTSDPNIAQYMQDNPKSGYLKLRVSTRQEAIPITNALAEVYLNLGGERYLIVSEQTDLSGFAGPIALPAPDKELTLDPRNPRPYSSYDLVVNQPGYDRVEVRSIPIFDNITSVQQVNLIPIGS